MSCLFFEHKLTRIRSTDLSGRQNPQLVPLFSLCLSVKGPLVMGGLPGPQ